MEMLKRCKKILSQKEKISVNGKEYEIFNLLLKNKRLILIGPPGVGKSFEIENIRRLLHETSSKILDGCSKFATPQDQTGVIKITDELTKEMDLILRSQNLPCKFLVMHPSYSYEEAVIGLKIAPSSSTSSDTSFVKTPGDILSFFQEACKELIINGANAKPFLLVLDEINRCNLPSVLGEFIYLFDYSKIVTVEKLAEFREIDGDKKHQKICETYGVQISNSEHCIFFPENMHVLGTMNSSDRSIIGFDQALRRRFAWYRMKPLSFMELFRVISKNPTIDHKVKEKLCVNIAVWSMVNNFFEKNGGEDAKIGHSYWFDLIDLLQKHNIEDQNQHCNDYIKDTWSFHILPQIVNSLEFFNVANNIKNWNKKFNDDVTKLFAAKKIESITLSDPSTPSVSSTKPALTKDPMNLIVQITNHDFKINDDILIINCNLFNNKSIHTKVTTVGGNDEFGIKCQFLNPIPGDALYGMAFKINDICKLFKVSDFLEIKISDFIIVTSSASPVELSLASDFDGVVEKLCASGSS